MTVRELIETLSHEANKDRLVVMSKDAEGNNFSPLAAVDATGYIAGSTWSGEITDDGDENHEGAVPALVLWPTN